MTSIVIIPTFNNLFSVVASETTQEASLFRGFLWSSVIGSIMVVVAVYGLAILLNIQWLRFAGIYGLLCIFAKAWIMLISWLATSPAYWGMIGDITLNSEVNLACVFITLLLYYAWQKRSKIRIKRLTYYAGIIASYDLFLIFSFLFEFILFNSIVPLLNLSFQAIALVATSGTMVVWVAFRKEFELPQGTIYTSIIGFVLSEISASSVLLSPIYYQILPPSPLASHVLIIIFFMAGVILAAVNMLVIVISLTKIRKN